MSKPRLSTTLIKLGIQVDLQYKARSIMWMMHSLIWVFVFSAVWLSIYSEDQIIEGFSRYDIVTYFIGLLIIEHIVESFIAEDLNRKIREGGVSQLLLKPVSIMRYLYFDHLGYRITRIGVYLLVFSGAFLFFDAPFSVPQHWYMWLFMILAMIIGNFIAFFLSFIIGCLAFWFEEISHFIMVYWIVTTIPRGWSGPIDFLPTTLRHVFELLPWNYILYFPLMLFLEKRSGPEMLTGFAVATVWMIILFFVCTWVLKKSIKKYNAVGN